MTKPLLNLRKEIVTSIIRPDFLLKGSKNEVTLMDITWNNTYEILYKLLDCIRKTTLSQRAIDEILNSISKASYDLDVTLTGKQLLYTWVYIHGLIITWLEWAVELEEYHSASNLKRIIDVIYGNVEAYENESDI